MAKKQKTPQRPKVPPYVPGQTEVSQVNKRVPERVEKAAEDEGVEYWPEGYKNWTHEDYVADARAMQAADAGYVPTAEELAVAEHFAAKQASACGWYQVDPNADSEGR